MRGEEMWEQNIFGNYLAPSLAFAPASGRFVLSRVLVNTSTVLDDAVSSDQQTSQAIIVYQTSSGRQILRAECSPIERAGQNFDLSPNGLGLAIIHAEAIEVYSLPPPTTKEAADINLAEKSAPEENDAPIHFARSETSAAADEAASETKSDSTGSSTATENLSSGADQGTQAAQAASATDAASSQSASTPAGDAPADQPRKPPTLYTLPTDQPHPRPDNEPQ
jgi:hypothetical protein